MKKKSKDVTGRDSFILTQALATAYAVISSLPDDCIEYSNLDDMEKMLEHQFGAAWKERVTQLRHVLSKDESRNGKKPLSDQPLS